MSKSKENFYFRGKYFETQEEFFAYSKNWAESQVDESSFDEIMKDLLISIKMNMQTSKIKITNGELEDKSLKLLILFLKEMREK
jgi:hypothetical protein